MPSRQYDPTRDPLIRTFAAILRSHREAGRLSRRQLAEKLGCSSQWIEKLETGQRPPSEATADDLDTYFQQPGTFRQIWEQFKEARRHIALPPGFPAFITFESRAIWIRSFMAQVVPGLLQTEAYARGVMGSGQTREALDDLVCTRMGRQSILNRAKPPHLAFVLDESVLRRPVGSPETMREQLTYLRDVAATSPHIQVRILPFSSITWAALDGSFTMLGFADRADVAYLEGPGSSQLIDDLDRVADCAVRFNLIMSEALASAESLQMIDKALEAYT